MEEIANESGQSLPRTEVIKIEKGKNQLSSFAKRLAVAAAFQMSEEDVSAYLLEGAIDLEEAKRRRLVFIERRSKGPPKPYGDSPSWRAAEQAARGHELAKNLGLPPSAFYFARAMPALREKAIYTVLDVIIIAAYYWVTASEHEATKLETELRRLEEQEENKVRQLRAPPTPPPPKRKGPAVRSAQKR